MRTIYENPNKEQFEQWMFSTLKDEIEDFPQGTPDRPESPGSIDFIIKAPDKTIGIEVTRAVNRNYTNSTPLAEIRDAQIKCFQKAEQILAERGISPLDVRVRFRDDSARIDIGEAAQELCDFIQDKVGSIDDTKMWYYRENKLKHIKCVSVNLGTTNGKKRLDEHRVGWDYATRPNIHPSGIIQERIDAKQAKLANYQRQCDECWLIIGANERTAPEAITIWDGDNTTYFSDFARTYFVRGVQGRVWRLNTVPSV